MQKWEYKRFQISPDDRVFDYYSAAPKHLTAGPAETNQFLNRLGEEGWELVAVGGEHAGCYVFKRPKA